MTKKKELHSITGFFANREDLIVHPFGGYFLAEINPNRKILAYTFEGFLMDPLGSSRIVGRSSPFGLSFEKEYLDNPGVRHSYSLQKNGDFFEGGYFLKLPERVVLLEPPLRGRAIARTRKNWREETGELLSLNLGRLLEKLKE